MNTGTPTDQEKDQAKLNHETSGDNTQPSIGIGTNNIGVEKKLEPTPPEPKPQKEATITVTPAQVSIPPTTSSPPAQTPQPSAPPPSPPPASPPPPPPIQPESQEKIEVETTDIPIKTYDKSKTTDQPTVVAPAINPPPPPTPPVQSSLQKPTAPIKNNSGPAATIATLAILALIFGATGGFFGFRYFDRLKTSASTQNTSTPAVSDNTSPSTEIADWQTYTNSLYKFSLKYPNGWVSNNPDNQSDDIIFASDSASLAAATSGYRVEIVWQDSKGKTLKSWVEANATTTNEKKPVSEITVSGKTAYQQELSNNGPAIASYIELPDKIMIITFTAPDGQLGAGGSWYNKIINSIILN